MRPAAGILLLGWLALGLLLTLQPAHPLPGQVVDDNVVPFRTIGIYLANATDPFWIRQAIGNVLLLLPIGLLGPIALPALDRWWRILLVALLISAAVEVAQLWIPERSADVDDVMVNGAGAALGFVIYRLGRSSGGAASLSGEIREYPRLVVSMPALIADLARRITLIGADPGDDEDLRLRKGLLVLIAVLILPVSIVWGSLYLAFSQPVGFLPYVYFAVSIASIAIFARTRNFRLFLNIQLLDILLTTTIGQVPIGGFLTSGGVGLWGILAPLGALVFLDVRQAARWFVAFLAAFVGFGLVGQMVFPDPGLPVWFNTMMLVLNVVGGGSLVFTLLAIFASQRQAALSALRLEQVKSETLLLNMLPRSIAERLKGDSQTIADSFPSASILFADVVNFTPLSQHLPPDEVVSILDRLFSHFDAIAEHSGLEKIKTIGDAYMVAAGVPTPRSDHARAIALMALEMRDTMHQPEGIGDLGLEVRIGINSGPVVAGVIGRKRPLYDLWGDAVNTASRMQTQGESGKIQITRATHDLLSEEFVCERRGTIEVKGKGKMETWYLEGLRTSQVPSEDRRSA
jgi:adenylate cyclase